MAQLLLLRAKLARRVVRGISGNTREQRVCIPCMARKLLRAILLVCRLLSLPLAFWMASPSPPRSSPKSLARFEAARNSGYTPGLAVMLVGEIPASQIYVRSKIKTCGELGIYSEMHTPPASITTEELLALVHSLNARDDIDGILIQLPLPEHVDTSRLLEAVVAGEGCRRLSPHQRRPPAQRRARWTQCSRPARRQASWRSSSAATFPSAERTPSSSAAPTSSASPSPRCSSTRRPRSPSATRRTHDLPQDHARGRHPRRRHRTRGFRAPRHGAPRRHHRRRRHQPPHRRGRVLALLPARAPRSPHSPRRLRQARVYCHRRRRPRSLRRLWRLHAGARRRRRAHHRDADVQHRQSRAPAPQHRAGARPMLRVGLTGELGSGKSTVAQMLAAHGAIVLSSDEMGRAMMQPGQAGVRADRRTLRPHHPQRRRHPQPSRAREARLRPRTTLASKSSTRSFTPRSSPRRPRRSRRSHARSPTPSSSSSPRSSSPRNTRPREAGAPASTASSLVTAPDDMKIDRFIQRAVRLRNEMRIFATTPAAASKPSAPPSLPTSLATRSKTTAQSRTSKQMWRTLGTVTSAWNDHLEHPPVGGLRPTQR